MTSTNALGAVEADSVENLIRTTNARRRRAGLPRNGRTNDKIIEAINKLPD